VREERVLTLEEAVRKMTSLAADQFNIADRGILRRGSFADIVIFDPATIADTSTFESPRRYPIGIDTVIVNGVIAVREGKYMNMRAGRALLRRAQGSGQ